MVDPAACALFLIFAFVLAGLAQAAWLRSPLSFRFNTPIDRGLHFRGRPVFGPNKTVRGFVVMVPATAVSFCLLGVLSSRDPGLTARLWPLTPPAFGFLGFWAGLGFMLGELPNSFVKRQLGIPPGELPRGRVAKIVCSVADRLDSIAGMLLAVSIAVGTPWQTWVYLALLGPPIHWLFSALLYLLGVKARPA